jgi:hypothetical protein
VLELVVEATFRLGNVPVRIVTFGGVLLSSMRPVKRSTELFWSTSYENPVCTGWSRYIIFETSFQDQGLLVVELESVFIEHGPFSRRSPRIEDAPGPPFIQRVSGAFWGFFLAWKYQ